jgi:glutathione S-transferase
MPSASPSIRLYSARLSMFGAKVQIAAIEKGIALDLVMVPFTQAEGYSPKNPEVVRINPKKQVPVLVHGDLEIFDSTQILEYLEELKPEPALWLTGIARRARVRQLEHRSDEVYFPHVIKLMSLQDRLGDPQAVAALQGARDFYRYLEPLLGGEDYMLGRLFQCRHRPLHGHAVRRAHERSSHRRDAAAAGLARPDEHARLGAAGRDGPWPSTCCPMDGRLPAFMAKMLLES